MTVAQVLTGLVEEAARAAGHEGVLPSIEPAVATNDPRHGDYQSNHAFRLGKALKTNPRAVAEQVLAKLPPHPGVASVEVAGPGFLNFRLDPAWLAQMLKAQVGDERGGVPQTGAGRTVVIDYSSPNVAKRMHVGHMRSTIIGDALHRLYLAAGWTVVADNHIGDWGTQFGKLIVEWRDGIDEDNFARDPIGELERIYIRFGEKKTEEREELARRETAKLQHGEPENLALWRRFIDISMAEFEKVYQRLGVHFDVVLGESAYNEALPGVVEALLQNGVAEASEGAVVIKWGEEAPGALKNTVLVIRKKDGAYLYGTTDLATLDHRRRTWDPERVVYVTDTRQQLHFQQVFDAWRQWQPEARAQLDHTWFGMLTFGDQAMATREGNVIRLKDLLDEAARRAKAVVDEKSPHLPEAERAAIAEAVGVSAVRYADLSQNPQSNIAFEWDKMLSLEGNTAPYLMYSYARCQSILNKAGEAADLSALAFTNDEERALGVLLLRTPEVVLSALESHRPNLLCDHLFETVNAFGRFYGAHSVLQAETPALRSSRLALVQATAQVVERGLQLLGIRALTRM